MNTPIRMHMEVWNLGCTRETDRKTMIISFPLTEIFIYLKDARSLWIKTFDFMVTMKERLPIWQHTSISFGQNHRLGPVNPTDIIKGISHLNALVFEPLTHICTTESSWKDYVPWLKPVIELWEFKHKPISFSGSWSVDLDYKSKRLESHFKKKVLRLTMEPMGAVETKEAESRSDNRIKSAFTPPLAGRDRPIRRGFKSTNKPNGYNSIDYTQRKVDDCFPLPKRKSRLQCTGSRNPISNENDANEGDRNTCRQYIASSKLKAKTCRILSILKKIPERQRLRTPILKESVAKISGSGSKQANIRVKNRLGKADNRSGKPLMRFSVFTKLWFCELPKSPEITESCNEYILRKMDQISPTKINRSYFFSNERMTQFLNTKKQVSDTCLKSDERHDAAGKTYNHGGYTHVTNNKYKSGRPSRVL